MLKTAALNEEFDTFMSKVNEVTDIISKLSSKDPQKNAEGTAEADRFFASGDTIETVRIDDDTTVTTRTKYNKTLINKKALETMEPQDSTTTTGTVDTHVTSVDTFKSTVEEDVARRQKERAIRREQSDTFKKRGNNAFRQGDLMKALNYYNESIECIRDSPLLYTNRALTLINLELYDRAIEDCLTALKLDDESMKAWLYLAKCYICKNNRSHAEKAIREAKNRHPSQVAYIDEYICEVKRNIQLKKEMAHMEREEKELLGNYEEQYARRPPKVKEYKEKPKVKESKGNKYLASLSKLKLISDRRKGPV